MPSPFPRFLDEQIAVATSDHAFANLFVMFGAAGTYTLEHQDTDALGVLTTVLSGAKLFVHRPAVFAAEGGLEAPILHSDANSLPLSHGWTLPQLQETFLGRSAEAFLLQPGQWVYTPPGYLHSVLNAAPRPLAVFHRFLLAPMLPTAIANRVISHQTNWDSILDQAVALCQALILSAKHAPAHSAKLSLYARATSFLSNIQLFLLASAEFKSVPGLDKKKRLALRNKIKELFA